PSGGARMEYQTSSASPCTPENMVCTNGTLSCSVGNMSTDCQYSSCSPPPPPSNDTPITAPATTNAFAGMSAAIGDINGDGYADLVIAGGSNPNKVYVIFGSSTGLKATSVIGLNGTNGFELDGGSESGQSNQNNQGVAVGDVNGDGKDDIIIAN